MSILVKPFYVGIHFDHEMYTLKTINHKLQASQYTHNAHTHHILRTHKHYAHYVLSLSAHCFFLFPFFFLFSFFFVNVLALLVECRCLILSKEGCTEPVWDVWEMWDLREEEDGDCRESR